MDKKELLKRWALAYTEPSLFYIPWKNDKEGRISINSGSSYYTTIIGGIFTLDGKLIAKVDFKTSYLFQMNLKKGTYIYKEAVSPEDCELSNDVVVEIESNKTTYVVLTHKSTSSYFKRSYEKINPELYYPITPSEPYNQYELEHYNYFDWVLRQYSVEDDSLIRTIYYIKNRNNISPSTRYSYSNAISHHNYFFKAVNYGNIINQFEFEYDFEDEIQSTSPIWNDRELGITTVKQAWTGNHISCALQGNVTDERASWIENLSAEEIFNIYKFIIDNQILPSSTNAKLYYRVYTIWIYNNQYYANGAECGYNGFSINLLIYYRQTDVIATYPEEMLLNDNSDYSEDYIIKNNTTDTSKYFHNGSLNIGLYNQRLSLHTGAFVNQELLDIINNSESGGES